jgi:LmbE family N-acetylglucosaminyl deacetylase
MLRPADLIPSSWSSSTSGQPLLPVRALHTVGPRVEPYARPALVVAPHEDDETFGCGGVIARKRARGVPVKVVFVTDGSRSHGPLEGEAKEAHVARRKIEAIGALAALGVHEADVTFLGLPDGALWSITVEQRGAVGDRLRALLAEIHAAEVFVPYRRDGHRDHEATFALARNAVQRSGRAVDLFEYPIWICERLDRWQQRVSARTLLDARVAAVGDDALTRKRVAVETYASQREVLPPGFTEQFLTGNELFFVTKGFRG